MRGDDDKKSEEKKTWYYRVCPKCKSKVHIERGYCACTAYLWDKPVYEMEALNPPKMYGKVNLNLPNYSCEACGANCHFCVSHGVGQKNSSGFGGLDCEHKQDSIKCTCCQIFIKNMERHPGEIDRVITESIQAVRRILDRRGSGNPELAQERATA